MAYAILLALVVLFFFLRATRVEAPAVRGLTMCWISPSVFTFGGATEYTFYGSHWGRVAFYLKCPRRGNQEDGDSWLRAILTVTAIIVVLYAWHYLFSLLCHNPEVSMASIACIASPFTGIAKSFLSVGRKAINLVANKPVVEVNRDLVSQVNTYSAKPRTQLARPTVGKQASSINLPFAAGIGVNQNGVNPLSVLVAFNRELLADKAWESRHAVIKSVLAVQEQALADGCANTEDFADNKGSDRVMPAEYMTLFGNSNKAIALQSKIGMAPDTINLKAVQVLTNHYLDGQPWPYSFSIGGTDGTYAAKRPLLSLGDEHYHEVLTFLVRHQLEVLGTGIREAVSEAIDGFTNVHMRAQVESGALYYNNLVNWINEYFVNHGTESKLSDLAQAELDIIAEAYGNEWNMHEYILKENARVGGLFEAWKVMPEKEKAFVRAEQSRFRADICGKLNIKTPEERATVALISKLHGVKDLWIFEYQHKVFSLACDLLETPEAEKMALVDTWIETGVSPDHINKALEAAKTGKFTNISKNGEIVREIECDPAKLFTICDKIGVILSNISATREEDVNGTKVYHPVEEHLIDDMKPLEAWNLALETVFGMELELEDEVETPFFRINKSVNNGQVDPDGNVVWPIGFERGEGQSSAYLGNKETVELNACVDFQVKPYVYDNKLSKEENEAAADAHAQKVEKRLGLFGTYYQKAVKLPTLVELTDELQHVAHEGRGFANPKTVGLPAGVYSSCRGLTVKQGLLKFVLEVNPAVPVGALYYTTGSTKGKELDVLRGSDYLMVGYKHHNDSARTSWCWLNNPEQFTQAVEWQKYKAYDQAPEAVRRANKRIRGDFPSAGLAHQVARQAIGNADNLSKGKFRLYDFEGCVKSYVRGRAFFDAKTTSHCEFKLGGDVCVVSPEAYELIAEICGGADSDDVYYVREVEGGWEFRRDPNVGVETAFLSRETGEVS